LADDEETNVRRSHAARRFGDVLPRDDPDGVAAADAADFAGLGVLDAGAPGLRVRGIGWHAGRNAAARRRFRRSAGRALRISTQPTTHSYAGATRTLRRMLD